MSFFLNCINSDLCAQPGNGFLEALIRPNVTTFTQGIKKITPKGVMNEDGVEIEVDVIICATG